MIGKLIQSVINSKNQEYSTMTDRLLKTNNPISCKHAIDPGVAPWAESQFISNSNGHLIDLLPDLFRVNNWDSYTPLYKG